MVGVLKLSRTKKRRVVNDARTLVNRLWPQLAGGPTCLQQACALQLLVAKRHGLTAILQAGDACWQRNATEGYGYEWESRRASRLKPHEHGFVLSTDVHVWLAVVSPQTLIDPTTADWPAHAAQGGYEWLPEMKPPRFMWDTTEKLARLARPPIYRAVPEATLWAVGQAQEDIYPMLGKVLGVDWRAA
jgi:hypothetical protein